MVCSNLAKVEVVSSNLIARSIFSDIKNARSPRIPWGSAYAGQSCGDWRVSARNGLGYLVVTFSVVVYESRGN
jgi:hypothetical protein